MSEKLTTLSLQYSDHFFRYAEAYNEYAVKRYQDEVKRLYGVLDKHLNDAKSDYLVGDKCTIVRWPPRDLSLVV